VKKTDEFLNETKLNIRKLVFVKPSLFNKKRQTLKPTNWTLTEALDRELAAVILDEVVSMKAGLTPCLISR
jgi:hypothetical protein